MQVSFQFSHFSHQISFHVAEKSVHISSRLLVCVCTFLLVDKIVYGLLAFGDACFSFCIKSCQIFRIMLNSLGECSSSSSIFEISVKFQSVAFSGSFAMKNDNIHIFFAVLVAYFVYAGFAQNRNTRLGPSWKRSVLQNPDRERTNQSARNCVRLALPYNKGPSSSIGKRFR